MNLALSDENREGLLDCLAALIDHRFGGAVTKRHLAQLVVARRPLTAAPTTRRTI